ncbi:protein-glutamate methylesterase/protein-glutamine glutaminase [Bacillus marasmi]|uniref:protein-glutamate methylesterase/protein-glutamine glutaminase n=1 Tax=Bacillus marasmi TaxID=1926279 RepID=UPI0011C8926C|nr:chemotaxis response regulator protein-glutamate methylesterase [Bacillus marasmi]
MDVKKIKVLVVDDSRVHREIISRGISSDPAIEVVGAAQDAFEATDMLLKYRPDVLICDIVMPKMNGIEYTRKLLPQYPIPVIVLSSLSEAALDAIHAGAVDFVCKPNVGSPQEVEKFLYHLINKIKIASQSKIIIKQAPEKNETQIKSYTTSKEGKIIAIGASTGGTEALLRLFKQLPRDIPGIVVVQHIPANFSRMFAERLDAQTHFAVKEAEAGDIVEPGKIYIAPGERHMRIIRRGFSIKLDVFKGEKVSGHCPSVDVLFESVAKEIGKKAIGIILTGMGSDGAKGLLSIRQHGGRTIGQDEASSVVYGMPKVAYSIGAVEKQGSIERIPTLLLQALINKN